MRLIINHLLLLLLLSFSSPALALDKFSDMPKGHWAESAVYSLVQSGISSGYPDGTFRGRQPISRYEMASLAYQLYLSLIKTKAAEEKIYHELLSEISLARYDVEKAQEYALKKKGYFNARFMHAQDFKVDYRLKYLLSKRVSDQANVKIEFDTLDAGFNNINGRALGFEMLSFSAGYDAGDYLYKMDLGPGNVLHDTNGLVPSEDYTYFQKTKPSLMLSSQPGWFQYSLGYLARGQAPSGTTLVDELNASALFTFFKLPGLKKINLIIEPRYVFGRIRGDFTARLIFADNLKMELTYGLGEAQYGSSGSSAQAKLEMNNLWPGLGLDVRGIKVGSKFRPAAYPTEFDLYNYFNRAILDGFVDLGFSLKQKINSWASVYAMFDCALTGDLKYGKDQAKTYTLYRLGFSLISNSAVSFDGYYECLQVPSQIDQFKTLSQPQNGVGVLQGKFSF